MRAHSLDLSDFFVFLYRSACATFKHITIIIRIRTCGNGTLMHVCACLPARWKRCRVSSCAHVCSGCGYGAVYYGIHIVCFTLVCCISSFFCMLFTRVIDVVWWLRVFYASFIETNVRIMLCLPDHRATSIHPVRCVLSAQILLGLHYVHRVCVEQFAQIESQHGCEHKHEINFARNARSLKGL